MLKISATRDRLAKALIIAALVAAAGLGTAAVLRSGNKPRVEAPTLTVAPVSKPYSVTMSPMGEVHFARIPERVVTLDANYNDLLVALGQERKLIATGYQGNFYDGFYAQLSGHSHPLDPARLTFLAHPGGGMFDKELLYTLRADIHHIDPFQLATSRGWTQADVDEIARNVGPFFANRYSRDDNYPGAGPYTYYSEWELSQKVAEVYHATKRIARLKEIYDRLVARIQEKLPPAERRPKVGLVYYNNGRFTPYSLIHGGFGQAQYRDVGAIDAFASIENQTYGGAKGSAGAGAMLDGEGLLALNPDVLIMPLAIYQSSQGSSPRRAFEQMQKLANDPLLQRISAFKTGRIFPGGTPLQGPLFYLFQIEMAAKQIYPEIFGPYRDDQSYPTREQLFDRHQVDDILQEPLDDASDAQR